MASPAKWKSVAMIAVIALMLLRIGLAEAPSSPTPADKVTPKMEADFLTKVKAAMGNEDALAALFASGSAPPQAKAEVDGFLSASRKAVGSHPNNTFVYTTAIPVEGTSAAVALRLTQVPATQGSTPSKSCEYTFLLAVSKHELVAVGSTLFVRTGAKRFDKISVFSSNPLSSQRDPVKPWRRFTSVDDYKKALEISGISILDAGEVDRVFYAVGQAKADLCLFAQSRDAQKKDWRFQSVAVVAGRMLGADVAMLVSMIEVHNPPMTLGPRFLFKVPPSYRGDVTVTVRFRIAKELPRTFSRTVRWAGQS